VDLNKCEGCDSIYDPYCIPKLKGPDFDIECPCGECLVKMICSTHCEDWHIFWEEWKEIAKDKKL
jgi:hypothetical protein